MTHQGTLARLLAKENLKIIHGKFQTAFFVPKDRTLGLPIWKDRGKDVYDLLVGHEVGHALFTPEDWTHDVSVHNIPPSFLNILEDIRIEKEIQKRYPGLVKSFKYGYNVLYKEGFFGSHESFDNLGFMDRLNISSKLRDLVDIDFDEEELYYLNMAHNTNSWEDVVNCATEIYKWLKEKKSEEETEENNSPNGDYEYIEDDDEMMMPSDQDYQQQEEETEEKSEDTEEGEEKLESSAQNNETSEEENNNEEDEKSDDLEAITDTAFRKKESELNMIQEEDNNLYFSSNDREDFNQDVVIGWKEVVEARKSQYYTKHLYRTSGLRYYFSQYLEGIINSPTYSVEDDGYDNFMKEADKLSSTMAKEFELKKAATNYSRASISNTGNIDVNKIHSYKFNDDIFLKAINIPNDKNHGIIMLIDYSISMSKNIHNVIRQVIVMALYCKKINIPFNFYGFSCDPCDVIDTESSSDIYKPNTYYNMMINLISSEMPRRIFDETLKYLYRITTIAMYGGCYEYAFFATKYEQMRSTPIATSLLSLYYLIPEFKNKYNIENMNLIVLSDGESNMLSQNNYRGVSRKEMIVFDTPYSRLLMKLDPYLYPEEEICKHIVMDLKKKFNCTTLGFFVSNSNSELRHKYDLVLRELRKSPKHHKYAVNSYKNLGKNGIIDFIGNVNGFDKFYIIKAAKNLKDDNTELVIKNNTSKDSIKTAFSKYTKSKKVNKLFASMISDMIAI